SLICEFDSNSKAVSSLWKNIENLLDMCRAESASGNFRIEENLDELENVFLLLKKARGSSPAVLCHGDPLAGNILRMADGSICFIDYEYSGVMERAFDIAGHFIEYAGFECDWGRIPSPAAQRAFIRVYL
ncbi:hypothetical protein ETH_00037570, partial [Eimeria tenella]